MGADWQLCCEWLFRCQVLSKSKKSQKKSANVCELAQALRNGVVLCRLVNKIEPGAIPCTQFRDPDWSQFLSIHNVLQFLSACREVFFLEDRDLFEPGDLVYLKDFGKVIRTLSILSKAEVTSDAGIPGFSLKNSPSQCSAIYSQLPEFALSTFLSQNPFRSDLLHDEDEHVYTSTVSEDEGQGMKRDSDFERESCVQMIIDTEKNYTEALNQVVTHFVEPLRPFLSQKTHNMIFLGFQELYINHKGFLAALQSAYSCSACISKYEAIANCFIQWKNKFLVYGEYYANLPQAQNMLEEICGKDEAIRKRIEDYEMAANRRHFHLTDLLALPMQHLLKYELMLQKLVDKSPHDTCEELAVLCALEEMKDVQSYVEAVKDDDKTLYITKILEKSMGDSGSTSPLENYGHYLFDCPVKVKHGSDWLDRTRHVFIFDRGAFLCKFKVNRFQCTGFLDLAYYDIRIMDDIAKAWWKVEQQWKYPFELAERLDHDGEITGSYILICKTGMERNMCTGMIELAKARTDPEYLDTDEYDFHLTTFDKGTVCDICKKLFKGLHYQGFLCKITGVKLHSECVKTIVSESDESVSCGNDNLQSYPWYLGEMNHSTAEKCLQPHKMGTYMVRKAKNGKYALSIKNEHDVLHLKVKQSSRNPFYLVDGIPFGTLAELVYYYQSHTFANDFPDLQTTLQYAYADVVSKARAIYTFNGSSSTELSFTPGDLIEIVIKDCDIPGWYQGRKDKKFGYFPARFVIEVKKDEL